MKRDEASKDNVDAVADLLRSAGSRTSAGGKSGVRRIEARMERKPLVEGLLELLFVVPLRALLVIVGVSSVPRKGPPLDADPSGDSKDKRA